MAKFCHDNVYAHRRETMRGLDEIHKLVRKIERDWKALLAALEITREILEEEAKRAHKANNGRVI